jgi:hypothetical protein
LMIKLSVCSGMGRWSAHWWEGIYRHSLSPCSCYIYIKVQTWKFYILCAYNRQHQSGYMLFLGVFGRLLIMCHKNILPQFMSQRMVREFSFPSYKLKKKNRQWTTR